MHARILLVDDETTFRETFAQVLREEGFECVTSGHPRSALECLAESNFDLVLLDICLPGASGIEILRRIGEISPQTFTIMITAYGTIETAVEAMRLGAFDYLAKPLNFDEAILRIHRLMERKDAMIEIQHLRRELKQVYDFENIIGRSPVMEAVFDLIRKVSSTMSSVLITGETGSGKELVARAIHFNSEETKERRFVALNCAAIPDTLIEAELFGYAKGAFTGASADKKGYLEVAEGGSMFLDEIGEMGLAVQAKLLRAIEQREITRVGGTDPIPIRTRIICSTHRELSRMMDEGRFREDLYHRINVIEIHLSALRERREDIALLAKHFMEKYNRELKKGYLGITPEVMGAFMFYKWKGNVRELANVMERAMILGDGRHIRLADLPSNLSGLPVEDPDNLHAALEYFERLHVLRVLRDTKGDKEETSRRLGISLSTLYRRIDEFGLGGKVEALETSDPPTRG